MIAELLCHPCDTATRAESLNSRRNGPPDIYSAGMVTALQRRHEQGIGPDNANIQVHHEPPRPLALPGYITGDRRS
jgi:hypothetical protein